ncbi:hypothetical protein Tco_1079066 [Tanacetum coccineum]|uniref:Uncharacterized protein n=1 Tax=Tanacetum coccineum TaxID=301880 RepID=A0ABQ5HRW6_9ASTR
MGSSESLNDLHGEANPNLAKRDIQKFATTRASLRWGRFCFNPYRTNIELLPREYTCVRLVKDGNGPISHAPHVKDFTNLDGSFEHLTTC